MIWHCRTFLPLDSLQDVRGHTYDDTSISSYDPLYSFAVQQSFTLFDMDHMKIYMLWIRFEKRFMISKFCFRRFLNFSTTIKDMLIYSHAPPNVSNLLILCFSGGGPHHQCRFMLQFISASGVYSQLRKIKHLQNAYVTIHNTARLGGAHQIFVRIG